MAQPCKRPAQTPDPSHTSSKRPDQGAGERNCGDTNEPTTDDDASTIVGLDEKVDDWSEMENDNFKILTVVSSARLSALRRSSRELRNLRYQTAGDLTGGVRSSGAFGTMLASPSFVTVVAAVRFRGALRNVVGGALRNRLHELETTTMSALGSDFGSRDVSDERAAVGREGREKEKGKEAQLAAVAVRTSKANHYHLDARLFRWASLFQNAPVLPNACKSTRVRALTWPPQQRSHKTTPSVRRVASSRELRLPWEGLANRRASYGGQQQAANVPPLLNVVYSIHEAKRRSRREQAKKGESPRCASSGELAVVAAEGGIRGGNQGQTETPLRFADEE
ncbi:hypothetical protein HPB51_014505 [Rhipicephalus microplus]|uniref:Uncharacterized protein n=1 Tax=Rhipicephalus microplus TaxID=6941 RepID=A0A9J6EH89_RHIMP|nr:hypothetical protein HPB51_014505 [Rhipicephalus microplus]